MCLGVYIVYLNFLIRLLFAVEKALPIYMVIILFSLQSTINYELLCVLGYYPTMPNLERFVVIRSLELSFWLASESEGLSSLRYVTVTHNFVSELVSCCNKSSCRIIICC